MCFGYLVKVIVSENRLLRVAIKYPDGAVMCGRPCLARVDLGDF